MISGSIANRVPDFLLLDAGRAVAHNAMRRKALCHGRLRAAPGFAERFAKRAKRRDRGAENSHAPESLMPRGFAPRTSPWTARPVSGPFPYSP
jgi:hypothetical protein